MLNTIKCFRQVQEYIPVVSFPLSTDSITFSTKDSATLTTDLLDLNPCWCCSKTLYFSRKSERSICRYCYLMTLDIDLNEYRLVTFYFFCVKFFYVVELLFFFNWFGKIPETKEEVIRWLKILLIPFLHIWLLTLIFYYNHWT